MKKNKYNKIIDYEILQKPIMQIENILVDYDRDEKELIIKNVARNFKQRQQDQLMKDQLEKIPLGNLFKKIRNKMDEDDEDGFR